MICQPLVVYRTTIFISDHEFRNKHGDSDSEERRRRKILIFWKCVFRATGDFIFLRNHGALAWERKGIGVGQGRVGKGRRTGMGFSRSTFNF